MNSSLSRRQFAAIALALSVAAVIGFLLGAQDRTGRAPAYDAPQRSLATASKQNDSGNESAPSKPLRADLKTLSGRELLAALPALEQRARDGDSEATRLLYRQLAACTQTPRQSEQDVRRSAAERCQQQLDVAAQIRAEAITVAADPSNDETAVRQKCELWLTQALDSQRFCRKLSVEQLDRRFDWLALALQRHDHDATLDATVPGEFSVRGAERIRNADKLVELAQTEQDELNALIAGGDVSALERAMYAYQSDRGLLPRDPELSYALAYALSLADSTAGSQDASARTMQNLSTRSSPYPPLTAPQIDAARAKGLALYQSCCVRK